MRKYIITFSVLAVMALTYTAYAYYFAQVPVKGIASTLTDTIGPFAAEDHTYGYLVSDLDLQSSTTITQTVRPMAIMKDKSMKFIGQAITVASAVTADQNAIKTLLRNKDTNQIPTPEFYLQRVTTVTGDSVTDRKVVSFWGK